MAWTLFVSIFLNVIFLVHFFINYEPKMPFHVGERYIYRGEIIQIYTVHPTQKLVTYEKGSLSYKVLKEEGIPYTDELWNSILEKEKIKKEIENVLKEENIKV